jgi:hypothetical protein
VLGYIGHNLALLALPVVLAAVVLPWRRSLAAVWSAGDNEGVNASQALNIWIIQIVVAIGPPLGALAFNVYIKTDWGISLFFLVPLALVAMPKLRLPLVSPVYLTAIWLVTTLVVLAASPTIARHEVIKDADGSSTYAARSELARELTEAWHQRFGTRWPVVAGTTEIGEPMTFYSPDHPKPYTPGELWASGLTSLEEARQRGYIGICDTTDTRVKDCEAWMAANAANAEHIVINTRRFFQGHPGPATSWNIYIVAPAK